MARYTTNTSTSTATNTNTSTNTSTSTSTVTQTYLVNGSPVPEGTNGSALGDYTQTIDQDIVQVFDQDIVQDITQEIPIFSENGIDYAEAESFYNITPEGNISVDDGSELGNNITILEIRDDGYVLLEKDFVQNIDQDIVQDVFYEVDIVQDFIQTQEINQTYTADVIQTETRTRLAGE